MNLTFIQEHTLIDIKFNIHYRKSIIIKTLFVRWNSIIPKAISIWNKTGRFIYLSLFSKNESTGYSRHLYDLYKLSNEIVYDDEFYRLFDEVKAIRAEDTECLSTQLNQNIKSLLIEICNKDYFKKDYEDTTEELLFEKVNYKVTKDNLLKVIENLKD